MKNIVIILITLLTFSTDVLSQSVKPWKTRDGSIDVKSGFGFTYCYPQIYSHNKKVSIKRCDTTKYIYEGKKVKSYRYYVDIELSEIVILTNCNSTLVGKYDITKYKTRKIKDGHRRFYIVCKSKNKIKRILIDESGLTITTYDKKTKNTTISVVTHVMVFAKGNYYE